MLRAAKFRLYPTPEQEKFLWGQWGAVRFVWNKALWLKRRFWKQKGESLSVIMDLKPLLAVAKKSKKYAWLKQYDSMALQESLRHLDGAYRGFFKHEAGFPKWKSRRGEQSSYHCTCVSVGEGWIRVPKIGRIKAVVHRKVEGKVKSITLSADTTGAYYAAVLYDDGLEEVKPIVDVYEGQVTGIDLGLKDLAIESNGTKEPNPKHLKKAEKHLRRVSKKFSRTKKGSRRHEKARKRLAKAHKRVANARNDRLHKISLCPQVSRGERALSRSSSNSSFLSDVRTSNDSSMGATQWQFQRAENPWSTVLRCVVPVLGLVCDQDAHFPSVPFCRHARTLADTNTHWQSLSLR